MASAATATPTIVSASNGMVLDHIVYNGGKELVTVDTSAITPTKSHKSGGGGREPAGAKAGKGGGAQKRKREATAAAAVGRFAAKTAIKM